MFKRKEFYQILLFSFDWSHHVYYWSSVHEFTICGDDVPLFLSLRWIWEKMQCTAFVMLVICWLWLTRDMFIIILRSWYMLKRLFYELVLVWEPSWLMHCNSLDFGTTKTMTISAIWAPPFNFSYMLKEHSLGEYFEELSELLWPLFFSELWCLYLVLRWFLW